MAKSGIYGGADPRDLPAYPVAEVAHFLWMARGNVGRWAFGYEAGVKHLPVIRVADPERRLLSFNNLAELHVLNALRHHRVPLQRIRAGVRYLRERVVGQDHPHLTNITAVVDGQQPRAVTIDPVVSFGRPVLAGTRIPTVELANRFSAGEPIESLSLDLSLEKETIEEAIRYQLATRGRAA